MKKAKENNGQSATKPGTRRPKPKNYANHARDAELWAATRSHLWPWNRWEYRGWINAASQALNFKGPTITRWLGKGSRGVSVTASRRIAALLRSRAETELTLAAEWERYADDREAAWLASGGLHKGFRASVLDEKQGWRSAPRKTPTLPR